MIDASQAYSRTKDFYGLDSIENELDRIFNDYVFPAISQGRLYVKDIEVRDGIIDFVIDSLKDKGYSVVRMQNYLNIAWIRH